MHDHTFPSDTPTGHDAQHAPLPKSRATRRAHGQRNTSPRVHSARLRLAPRAETGPQRAQRRAAAKGLTVGAPVRAEIGLGHNWPIGRNTTVTALAPARIDRPQVLSPLEFGERMSNYRLQQAVRTHSAGGSRWRPTPRQRRRLDKKARTAAVRKYLDGKATEARYAAENPAGYAAAMAGTRGPAASAVILDEVTPSDVRAKPTWVEPPPTVSTNPPQEFVKRERERSAMNRNGYRVVDRRGEHR